MLYSNISNMHVLATWGIFIGLYFEVEPYALLKTAPLQHEPFRQVKILEASIVTGL